VSGIKPAIKGYAKVFQNPSLWSLIQINHSKQQEQGGGGYDAAERKFAGIADAEILEKPPSPFCFECHCHPLNDNPPSTSTTVPLT
jgi:hypothetical protein